MDVPEIELEIKAQNDTSNKVSFCVNKIINLYFRAKFRSFLFLAYSKLTF